MSNEPPLSFPEGDSTNPFGVDQFSSLLFDIWGHMIMRWRNRCRSKRKRQALPT